MALLKGQWTMVWLTTATRDTKSQSRPSSELPEYFFTGYQIYHETMLVHHESFDSRHPLHAFLSPGSQMDILGTVYIYHSRGRPNITYHHFDIKSLEHSTNSNNYFISCIFTNPSTYDTKATYFYGPITILSVWIYTFFVLYLTITSYFPQLQTTTRYATQTQGWRCWGERPGTP